VFSAVFWKAQLALLFNSYLDCLIMQHMFLGGVYSRCSGVFWKAQLVLLQLVFRQLDNVTLGTRPVSLEKRFFVDIIFPSYLGLPVFLPCKASVPDHESRGFGGEAPNRKLFSRALFLPLWALCCPPVLVAS